MSSLFSRINWSSNSIFLSSSLDSELLEPAFTCKAELTWRGSVTFDFIDGAFSSFSVASFYFKFLFMLNILFKFSLRKFKVASAVNLKKLNS